MSLTKGVRCEIIPGDVIRPESMGLQGSCPATSVRVHATKRSPYEVLKRLVRDRPMESPMKPS